MSLGALSLLVAAAGAVWLLFRLVKGEGDLAAGANMTLLKVVVLLGLVAALFAARLWPLAFMVLFAAGGVMAIEQWKDKSVSADEPPSPPVRQGEAMTVKEAAAVLGVGEGATREEIRLAHKRLISQLHPDKGGSDYLAAKINEARDLMIAKAPDDDEPPEADRSDGS
ncbi:MAG: molecular chaperone DnaJ [Pseudomonadota bacterium]